MLNDLPGFFVSSGSLSVHQPTVNVTLSMVIYVAMNKNPNLLTDRDGNGLYSTNT